MSLMGVFAVVLSFMLSIAMGVIAELRHKLNKPTLDQLAKQVEKLGPIDSVMLLMDIAHNIDDKALKDYAEYSLSLLEYRKRERMCNTVNERFSDN